MSHNGNMVVLCAVSRRTSEFNVSYSQMYVNQGDAVPGRKVENGLQISWVVDEVLDPTPISPFIAEQCLEEMFGVASA